MDLVGIEPTTSSMPWKRAPKLRHRPTCSAGCNFTILSVAGAIRQSEPANPDAGSLPDSARSYSEGLYRRSDGCMSAMFFASCAPSVAFLRIEPEGAIRAPVHAAHQS